MRQGKPALARDHGITKAGPSATVKPSFLAVDPGDVHVGVAEFTRIDGDWYCTWAHEFDPNQFLLFLVEGLRKGRWIKVIVESWKLFPQAAPIYIGSDMPTSRLIGGIAALVSFLPEDGAWFDERPGLVLQDPQIKVPTRGYLKRRKLRSVAKILGVALDHASDAELHGYKYLIDRKSSLATVVQQDTYWADTRDLSPRHSIW